MKMSDNPKLLLEVARLYYDKGLNKTEIADIFDISATQVTRLLKAALDKKIVEIKFSPPRLEELGTKLTDRFPSLRKAIVVPSTSEADYPFQRKLWGAAAADYLETNIMSGSRVGISGGYTCYEMIEALPPEGREIEIFPTAIIGRGPKIAHLDPMVLVTLLWAKSGRMEGAASYVTIPPAKASMSAEDLRKQNNVLRDTHDKVRQVYDEMKKIDFFFGSIGTVGVTHEHSHHTTIKLLEEVGVSEDDLQKMNIVGDINYSFFDADGMKRPDEDFFLTLDVKHLREMAKDTQKHVVVMAGHYKQGPLKVVLQTGLCNVLITDAKTAKALLNDPTPEWDISE